MPLRKAYVGIYAALIAAAALPVMALPLLGLAPISVWWLVPVCALVAYPISRTLAGPLQDLLDTAERLKKGDLRARTYPRPGSSWAVIGGAMGDLAERLVDVTQTLDAQIAERTAMLARKADQLRAVGQVGQQVAAVLEPEALLHFVVRVMRGTFGYDVVAVLRCHQEHLVLAACAARGVEDVPLGRIFPLQGGVAPEMARCVDSAGGMTSQAPAALVTGVTAGAELAVPMRLGGRTLGVLVLQSLQPGSLDAEDLFTAGTIAGQVAVALENARLLEAERQLRGLAVAEERNRMAREIHDTLAQGFMGILMQLRAMAGSANVTQVDSHREQAESLAREGLEEARRSVWNLRPHPLEGRGLADALEGELERLRRRATMQADLTTEGDCDTLPPAVEACLLRIAQEALHNTVKHARAGRVTVHVTVSAGWAELAVMDDGQGFAPQAVSGSGPPGGGFGLLGMAERAKALGGTLAVESAPGEGCCVTARIPLRAGMQ